MISGASECQPRLSWRISAGGALGLLPEEKRKIEAGEFVREFIASIEGHCGRSRLETGTESAST